jgi:hypothetical protein
LFFLPCGFLCGNGAPTRSRAIWCKRCWYLTPFGFTYFWYLFLALFAPQSASTGTVRAHRSLTSNQAKVKSPFLKVLIFEQARFNW